jgi:hypothetical protein
VSVGSAVAAETADPTSTPRSKVSPGLRRLLRCRPPLSVAVLAVPAAVAVIRLIVAARHPFDFSGDQAILESSVRHVGHELLGPYSRFSFHQPGPALFWVLAPFYRLPGLSPAAMFLGAFCINVGSALGCVLVVRRFLGEASARWTAAVVGALLLSLTPRLLADPWNPYVLALPALLTVTLTAAAAGGSLAAAAGAAVGASFLVQTHLAVGPMVAAVCATTAVIAFAFHRIGHPRPHGRGQWAAVAAAAVVLVLVWTPPVIEQATRSPGNMTKLVRFFGQSHPEFDRGVDHGLGATAKLVSAQLTVLPFGHDQDQRPTEPIKVVLAGLAVLGAAAVAVAGWRRRLPFIAGLGAASVVGPLVAVWSGTRIVGEVYPYLLVWACPLLLPGVIGAGALFLSPSGSAQPARPWATRVAAVAAAGIGSCLVWTAATQPLVRYPPATDVVAAARLAQPWLTQHGVRQARIRIAQPPRWPVATGMAVRLEKAGVRTTVDEEWTPVFGEHFRPTGRETAEVWIADAAGRPPGSSGTVRLGTAGNTSVWVLADTSPGG